MNRLIPDFSKDKAVNSLSWFAEICFRRIWNKADDFGRYYADEQILKAELFPRKEIRTPDLCRALQECERAALLVQYTVNGEQYLQLRNFNQRVRASKSRFPEPPDTCQTNDGQMSDRCPLEHEHEHEEEEKGGGRPPDSDIFVFLSEDFKGSKEFVEAWNDWLEYRKQRKLAKWVSATLQTKAKQFAAWGVQQTIENIRYSIGNGYQGIFPEKKNPQEQPLTLQELKAAYRHKINYNDPMHPYSELEEKALRATDIESFKRYLDWEYDGVVEVAQKRKQKGKKC